MTSLFNFYFELEYMHLYQSSFIGSFVKNGSRGWAESLYIDVFFALKSMGGNDPLWLFSLALLNISPLVFLKPCNLGGVIHYSSLPVMGESNNGIHTIICLVRSLRVVSRSSGVCSEQVAEILYEASENTGLAIDQNMEIYSNSLDY